MVKRYFILIFFSLLIACSSSSKPDLIRAQITERKVVEKLNSEVKIEEKKTVLLKTNNGPILGHITQMKITPLGSFILIDFVRKAVYEYNASGDFVQQIGLRGDGAGEYLLPVELGIDSRDCVYVYDGGTRKLPVYNHHRALLSDWNPEKKYIFQRMIFCKENFGFQAVYDDRSGIPYALLRKVNLKNNDEIFSIRLSEREEGNLVSYLGRRVGLCFSPILDRIFYLFPWQYHIFEMDTNTGLGISKFGIKPPNFRNVEEHFDKVGLELGKAIRKGSILAGMMLLNGKDLLVRYKMGQVEKPPIGNVFCFFYQMSPGDGVISAIPVRDASAIDWSKLIASDGSLLYVYSPPDENDKDFNGKIKIYELSVKDVKPQGS